MPGRDRNKTDGHRALQIMDTFSKTDRNEDIKLGKRSIIPTLCENVMTQRKIQRQLHSVSVWAQGLSRDDESNTVNNF